MKQPNSIELSYIINRLSWMGFMYRCLALVSFLATFFLAYLFLTYWAIISGFVIIGVCYLSDVYYLKCERSIRRMAGYPTPAITFIKVLFTPILLIFYLSLLVLEVGILISTFN